MADTAVSALTTATKPLSHSDQLLLIQSSTSKKTTVGDVRPYRPVPVNGWASSDGIEPGNQIGLNASGVFSAIPIDLAAGTYDALGVMVSTASTGGTSTNTLAIYPSDSNRQYPDASSGALGSATVALTATGLAIATFGSALVLAAGTYWLGQLLVISSGFSVSPVIRHVYGATYNLVWSSAPTSLEVRPKGRSTSGLSAVPTGTPTWSDVEYGAGATYVIIRRSA